MPESPPAPTMMTRQELYDKIWTVSAVQLAKEIGVSDVAIAKACKRHQIPKPPLGYWAKKAAGKAPQKPPLPIVIDPHLQSVTFAPVPLRERPPLPSSEPGDLPAGPLGPVAFEDAELGATYERFVAAAPDVTVPDALRSPLPVVSATLAALRRGSKQKRGFGRHERENLVYPAREQGEACLDVQVGRDSIDRSARFLNTLFKTLDLCGIDTFTVKDGYHGTVMHELFGVRFGLRLRELTRREPHVATPKELADKAKYSFTSIPKWDYFPNGQLRLSLIDERNSHERRTWTDGKVRRVEQMIPEIVREVLQEVDRELAKRRVEHQQMRQRFDEARAREQAERRRKEEQARADELVREVERWELARRIRRYLRAARRTALERHGRIDPESETDRWLAWAESVALRFDPLRPEQ